MTAAENDFLTRIGPGAPMGQLMRQYWIPALQSTDLPEPDGAPMRVRLTFYHKHGDQVLLGEKDLRVEHYLAKMQEDYVALSGKT
ncbi:MAG TPA: hypothetical protein VMH87_05665 [Pseudomonadales bacterium]|nr:hypothetical protein [Pseudomonadales bacterium]